MRELTADLFISLDGFASGVNEPPFFGYFGDDLSAWIKENLDKPQTLIVGRVTYAALSQFAIGSTDERSIRMAALPKIVFSTTLLEPLAWKNTRLIKTPMEHELARLKQQEGDPPSFYREHQFGEEHDSIPACGPASAHDFPCGARQIRQRVHLRRIREDKRRTDQFKNP